MSDAPNPESPGEQRQGSNLPETSSEGDEYQEGKRAGAHPLVVVFVVIIGLWLALWIFIPGSKTQNPKIPPTAGPTSSIGDPSEAPVMFRVEGTIPELKVITVVVHEQATDSQVIGLLYRFREARKEHTLSTLLPPTTPGHGLGDLSIADIYVFSDKKYATAEAVEVLARGAHAPGHLYPRAIPFEVAMEQVRGHYRIDLNDPANPDRGSLGFADESGVHSRNYRQLF